MENILKVNNLKNTKNRKLILNLISKSDLPLSAEDIFKECNKEANINLSTVYRTLATLEERGVLIKQLRNDGKAYYQENKLGHKHLFICNNCGHYIILDNCPLNILLKDLAKTHNFTVLTHNIELYGLCKNCKK